MGKEIMFPDFIFESSWEVCNKVGGIYTVLSTRAKTLQSMLGDGIVFIGPDCRDDKSKPFFEEDNKLFGTWVENARKDGLVVRAGRWTIPGKPAAILVDFSQYYECKNEIYTAMWNDFSVDSLHAYGDYDEASMFSYAAAKVVENFYRHNLTQKKHVIYHCNEWMTSLGMLYIKKHLPQVATIFTTHATSIGRSISGNNKPLYDYLKGYNGDQMASELNMESKHSVEKQAALNADCFTTVSDITARECAQLLDKTPDVVLPNGFDDRIVPTGRQYTDIRVEARKRLFKIANALTGKSFSDDTLVVSTSGRYEFRNKGIDVFLDSVMRLRYDNNLKKDVLALIQVPAWQSGVREDLRTRVNSDKTFDTPLYMPEVTHELCNADGDKVVGMMRYNNMHNTKDGRVSVMFVPCYLDGDDGLFNMPYYHLIMGCDLCISPSYYEPWGYTPLEAVAFGIPCITTDLAGFGLWAQGVTLRGGDIKKGVRVVHRGDNNYNEVAEEIKNVISRYSGFTEKECEDARKAAKQLSKKALWKSFIKYYEQAYDIALRKAEQRIK